MPLYAVLRLEHPVVLIREIQEAALDATPLQRRECGHALIGRHPVIQLPLDHQHRHPPLVHKPCRIEFLVGLGLGKRGRSEEHTSELQSLMRISYAVFCLKKQKNTTIKAL